MWPTQVDLVFMKIIYFVLLAATISCASNPGTQSYQSTENHWETRIRVKMEEFDRMKVPQDSDMVSKRVLDPDFIREFKKSACVGKSGSCEDKFRKVILAHLQAAYNLARVEDYNQSCNMYPHLCDKIEFMEKAFIASHNGGVEELRKAWIENEHIEANEMTKESLRRPCGIDIYGKYNC